MLCLERGHIVYSRGRWVKKNGFTSLNVSGLAQTKRQTVANLIVFLDHTGVGVVNYSNILKKVFLSVKLVLYKHIIQ